VQNIADNYFNVKAAGREIFVSEYNNKQILVVDDEELVTDVLSEILKENGYKCDRTIDPFAALDMIKAEPYALVLSDIRMPQMNGIELMKKAKEINPDIDFIMVTAVGTADTAIKALRMGASDYITKPFDMDEIIASVDSALKNREESKIKDEIQITQPTNEEMNSPAWHFAQSLQIVAKLVGSDEAYSKMVIEHSKRVAASAVNVAKKMKLSSDERMQIASAAILHDIGKIGMPSSLLTTPYNSLGIREKQLYNTHPIRGEGIVKPIKALETVGAFIRHHHEKYGGGGYPDGLKGDKIPIGSRIIAIADAYDRNKHLRLQGEEYFEQKATPHIKDDTGKLFDPKIVGQFLSYLKELEEDWDM